MRRLLAWLAALLVAVSCSLPAVRAQGGPAPPPQASPAVPTAQPAEDTKDDAGVPQGVVAFLGAALVLVIICSPSRKG